MHKSAFKAAEASRCAKEQGKFWEMHHYMMANQKTLDKISDHAKALNIDMNQFEACLDTRKYADEVRKDMALAGKLGVTGTPSFILAHTDSQNASKVKGISLIRGTKPFPSFKQILDQALSDGQ